MASARGSAVPGTYPRYGPRRTRAQAPSGASRAAGRTPPSLGRRAGPPRRGAPAPVRAPRAQATARPRSRALRHTPGARVMRCLSVLDLDPVPVERQVRERHRPAEVVVDLGVADLRIEYAAEQPDERVDRREP